MVFLYLTCPTSPPNWKLYPELPVARNEALNSPARRCPKGSRMQPKLQKPCSSRRSPCFLLLGRSCRERRGRLLGAPGRLRTMQAEAPTCSQNRLEYLNSEEPASPTPSIPDPELCYTLLIAGSVPLSKGGLHRPSTQEGSQHAPFDDRPKNTAAQAPLSLALQLRKMAELLRPCVKLRTHAPPPSEPGRQQGLRPMALSSWPLQTPKTLCGHPPRG